MSQKKAPHIDDITLLAYLDSQVSPQLAAEIDSSPELQQRARLLAREQARLRLFLAPPDLVEDLDLLPDSLHDKLRLIVARLIFPLHGTVHRNSNGSMQPQSQLRGTETTSVLGGSKSQKMAFEAEDFMIVVETAVSTAHPSRFDLKGYILGWEEDEAHAEIWCEGEKQTKIPIDHEDEFFASALISGTYQIALISANYQILLEPFSLK